jgi:hypothetical protein
MKLVQWWLVHHVPIDMIITPEIEAAACERFKILEWKWEEAKKRFPSLLPKVNQKRLRRMEFALETGKVPPNGWTPPDPKIDTEHTTVRAVLETLSRAGDGHSRRQARSFRHH